MSTRPASPGLFAPPALRSGGRADARRRPAVHDDASAEAVRVVNVEPFAFPGTRVAGAEVELVAYGTRYRLLVRAGRVAWPHVRGQEGAAPEDESRRARVEAAALEAAGRVLS